MTQNHAIDAAAERRGIATILAVSFVAVVGMAFTAMAWRLTHEANGRRMERIQAELHQLLLAGAADSPRLFTEQRQSWETVLPEHLRERRASVWLTMAPPQRETERLVRVEASLEGVGLSQTLRYVRGQQGWGLVEAHLDRTLPSSAER